MKTLKQIFASMWKYAYYWAAGWFWLVSIMFLLQNKLPQWVVFMSLSTLNYLYGRSKYRKLNRT